MNTGSVTIDPQGYPGIWQISGLPAQFRGPQGQLVVKGQTYRLTTGGLPDMTFAVGGAGRIATSDPRWQASGTTVQLLTFPIAVNVAGWRGTFTVTGVTGALAGNQTVKLAGGTSYTLTASGTSAPIAISIDSSGSVLSSSSSVIGGSKELTFNVQAVAIDRNGYAPAWSIAGWAPWRRTSAAMSR